jgi:tetratricopeptide (TPR) repeat protein
VNLVTLGAIAAEHGDFAGARSHWSEALDLFRGLSDPWRIAVLSYNLAALDAEERNYQSALERGEAALNLFRDLNDQIETARTLMLLGYIHQTQGEYDRAESLFDGALSRAVEVGNLEIVAHTLFCLGEIAAAGWKGEHAVRLLAAARALKEDIEMPFSPYEQERFDRALQMTLAQLDDERSEAAWGEGYAMTADEVVEYLHRYKESEESAEPTALVRVDEERKHREVAHILENTDLEELRSRVAGVRSRHRPEES